MHVTKKPIQWMSFLATPLLAAAPELRRPIIKLLEYVAEENTLHKKQKMCAVGGAFTTLGKQRKLSNRAGPRQVSAPSRFIICRPLEPIFFKLFRPRIVLGNFLRKRA